MCNDNAEPAAAVSSVMKEKSNVQNGGGAATGAIWSGFYKKSVADRLELLQLARPELDHNALKKGLPFHVADNMVENCIGVMGLPLGLGLNFVINKVSRLLPMCVEEPSVIAAASGVAKLIQDGCGGFTAKASERNIMVAQVQLLDCPDIELAHMELCRHRHRILEEANTHCASMVRRGGGVVDMEVRTVGRSRRRSGGACGQDTIVVHLHVDVCEAMGANCCNTVAEGVADLLGRIANARVGLRILSNLSVQRLVRASFVIPCAKLAYKGMTGEAIANAVVDACDFADCDPFRAVTHNKGIMNGMDAVALATGQDWRAIESACHAYTMHKHGRYTPMTWYDVKDGCLHGEIEVPMPVGTQGGAVKTNNLYKYTHRLMGSPNSNELAECIACVGLAQNFAALRALSSEGIQRGHMGLHARNIAAAVGASPSIIAELAEYMIRNKKINRECAQEYLRAHALKNSPASIPKSQPQATATNPPSMFRFEDVSTGFDSESVRSDELSFNVAFQTLGNGPPVFLTLGPNPTPTADTVTMESVVFGEKNHAWVTSVLANMEKMQLTLLHNEQPRSNTVLQMRLKVMSVLINVLVVRLLEREPELTVKFLRKAIPTSGGTAAGIMGRKNHHRWASDIDYHDSPTPSVSTATTSSCQSSESSGDAESEGEDGNGLGPLPFPLSQDDAQFDYKALFPTSLANELLDRSAEVRQDIVRVGFPLVVALFQAMQHQVHQWVGESRLAKMLVDEQCRILLSFTRFQAPDTERHALRTRAVSAVSDHTGDDDEEMRKQQLFNKAMQVLSKRLQVTLCLLCDQIGFSSNIIDNKHIRVVRLLGGYFEWHVAAVHDVKRYEREFSSHRKKWNTYAQWLGLHNMEDSIHARQGFFDAVRRGCDEWRKALAQDAQLEHVYNRDNLDSTLARLCSNYNLTLTPAPAMH